MGLLDALSDPVLMAQIEENHRIIGKLAEQMGVTHQEARDAFWHFQAITTSEGQTLH